LETNIHYLKEEPTFQGRLNVKVLEGRDLAIKDDNGTSDPFCILTLCSPSTKKQATPHKTKIAFKSLDPVWLDEFNLTLSEKDIETHSLRIVVWDHDLITQNDYMGEVVIPMTKLKDQQILDDWFPLVKSNSQDTYSLFKESENRPTHKTLTPYSKRVRTIQLTRHLQPIE